MTERVYTLEQLGEKISAGKPADLDYVLGTGSERRELLVTHNDRGKKSTERITSSSVRVRLYDDDSGETIMDIKGPRGRSFFTGLTPRGATYTGPEHPRPDSGSLEIVTGEDSYVGISEYYRAL